MPYIPRRFRSHDRKHLKYPAFVCAAGSPTVKGTSGEYGQGAKTYLAHVQCFMVQ